MTTSTVEIVDVTPRDGLQNERRILDTDQKAALLGDLIAAGPRRIEATSFVHPRRVPQIADAEPLLDTFGTHEGTSFIGVVLNARGASRAVANGWVDELNYVVPVTNGFSQANQATTTDRALLAGAQVRDTARAAGKRFSITLAVAFGCPYEGDVGSSHFAGVAERAVALDPDELALADTIGCAVPGDVCARITLAQQVTDIPLPAHFHDTRRTGLANAHAAVDAGIRIQGVSKVDLGVVSGG